MNDSNTHKYDDIIHLPHHVSKRHPKMSPLNRAAQFSPFAALTGHSDAIRETERLTDSFSELDEDRKAQLDEQLSLIRQNLDHEPKIEITCFQPDAKKNGGAYVTVFGKVKKIDELNHQILFTDGTALQTEQIRSIRGELFKDMDSLNI